jgi:hypothetical protein
MDLDANTIQGAIDRAWKNPVRAQRLATALALVELAAELKRRAETLLASIEPEQPERTKGQR